MFRRGKEHAGDSASSISAVQEFLAAHKEVDVLCLVQVKIFLSKILILKQFTVQCTSPFIQPDFLETGYKMVLQGYDSVFSVTR